MPRTRVAPSPSNSVSGGISSALKPISVLNGSRDGHNEREFPALKASNSSLRSDMGVHHRHTDMSATLSGPTSMLDQLSVLELNARSMRELAFEHEQKLAVLRSSLVGGPAVRWSSAPEEDITARPPKQPLVRLPPPPPPAASDGGFLAEPQKPSQAGIGNISPEAAIGIGGANHTASTSAGDRIRSESDLAKDVSAEVSMPHIPIRRGSSHDGSASSPSRGGSLCGSRRTSHTEQEIRKSLSNTSPTNREGIAPQLPTAPMPRRSASGMLQDDLWAEGLLSPTATSRLGTFAMEHATQEDLRHCADEAEPSPTLLPSPSSGQRGDGVLLTPSGAMSATHSGRKRDDDGRSVDFGEVDSMSPASGDCTSHDLKLQTLKSAASFFTNNFPDAETMEVHAFWGQNLEAMKMNLVHTGTVFVTEGDRDRAGDSLIGSCFLQGFVLSPASLRRVVWDILSTVAIMYDLLTLPLMVFDFDTLTFAFYTSLATTLFWMVDIVFNFFVGYNRSDGCIEMRMGSIAKRYLKSWFIADVVIVAVDVSLLLMRLEEAEAVGAARVGKSLRVVRITRFLRMLRLIRVMRWLTVIEDLCDVFLSGPSITFLNIGKLMGGVAVFAHFIACGWYMIGEASGPNSWTAYLHEQDVNNVFRYLIAYHWTMAQFTPAPGNIHPVNLPEHLFTVCTLFVGFVIFSSLLGSTSALINQSRQQAMDKIREADILRRFFVDNHVSVALSSRITNFLKANQQRKNRIKERDVTVLKSLPLSLQVELHFAIYSQILVMHPIFAAVRKAFKEVIVELCHKGVNEVSWAKGDELFHFRTPCYEMLFLVLGRLHYISGPPAFASQDRSRLVTEGTPMCEAVLWTKWLHLGLLSATWHASTVKVYADAFHKAAAEQITAFVFLKSYALEHIRQLRQRLNDSLDVDDLTAVFDTEDQIRHTLRTDHCQQAFGMLTKHFGRAASLHFDSEP